MRFCNCCSPIQLGELFFICLCRLLPPHLKRNMILLFVIGGRIGCMIQLSRYAFGFKSGDDFLSYHWPVVLLLHYLSVDDDVELF